MPNTTSSRYVDLSHTIEHGMVTYKAFPGPVIWDFMSREASKKFYAEGTSFQIGKIEMIANTGTYVDSPFHRFENGRDISEMPVEKFADLSAVVVRVNNMTGRAVDRDAFLKTDVRGKAVLVHTGWARHWRTEQYLEGHTFLTEAAAVHLKEQGAVFVGIDSMNIDDTSGYPARAYRSARSGDSGRRAPPTTSGPPPVLSISLSDDSFSAFASNFAGAQRSFSFSTHFGSRYMVKIVIAPLPERSSARSATGQHFRLAASSNSGRCSSRKLFRL